MSYNFFVDWVYSISVVELHHLGIGFINVSHETKTLSSIILWLLLSYCCWCYVLSVLLKLLITKSLYQ